MRKSIKIILCVVCLLAAAAAAVFGWMRWQEKQSFDAAEELFAAGKYTEARAVYESIERMDKVEECDYELTRLELEAAVKLLEEGRYDAAKAEFDRLGDFENAADYIPECDFRKARAYAGEEKYSEAIRILDRLGDYPGAPELREECMESLYDRALSLAYECRLDEAMLLFGELGDYRDSQNLYRRCSDQIVRMISPWEEPVNYSQYAGQDMGDGILYWHRLGLIYVPKTCNAETRAMIFYPGGFDSALANNYITEYLHGTYGALPNAIMLFCYANGYYGMDYKIEDAWGALEQAAVENNVFLHDIALIGASMGAYTACHTAVWLYETEGIAANYVVTLDAGGHWSSAVPVLSTEDCDIAAEAGTEFILLEGDGVGMNILAIQTMVAHGMDVTIAHVRDYGHYGIIYDAMDYGIFNWVMGDGDRPDHPNYTYIPLDRNSTYPN